jgi:hypothetical protein
MTLPLCQPGRGEPRDGRWANLGRQSARISGDALLDLDDPARASALRDTIQRKPALRDWYEDVYARYAACIARTPAHGTALELGSGAGFAKDAVLGLVTSDVLPYDGVDRVVDGTAMPFADGELRFVGTGVNPGGA